MKRRDFLAAAAATAWSASFNWSHAARADQAPAFNRLPDRDGRIFLAPPKEFLFTDLRHINAGDLVWRGPNGNPIPVAGPPEPPVEAKPDNWGVARGVRFVAQKATKEGPIAEMPANVVYSDGLYRAWNLKTNYAGEDLGSYSGSPAKSITVQYSESKDGYAWQNRDLNEMPVSDVTGIDGDGFFIDPNGPPEERYKGIYNARVLDNVGPLWEAYEKKTHPRNRHVGLGPNYIYALFGLVSPDGLNWKLLPEPLLVHKGDTDNTVYYDAWLQKYVLYTRLMIYDRRAIGRAESDDFRHWGPVQPMLATSLADPCSYDIYLNARTSYPGLPEQQLMFPMIYRRDTQTSEIRMYTSMDGALWDRVPGGPVIEPSDPPGWDGVFLTAGKNLVPLGNDRVGIPLRGYSRPHKYPRWPGVITVRNGWATWPKGRLVGLVADQQGQFNTFGMPVTGQKLLINAKVHPGGEIRVGIHNADSRQPSDCDPITGDNLAHNVTWHGQSDPKVKPGDTVRMRIHLRAAELFGLQWT